MEAEGRPFAIIEADEVETDEDLRDYVLGIIRSDDEVVEISFADDTVEVVHKQKGHILALVPVTFVVKVIAHADGKIEISYPWYSVITIDHKTVVETKLKIAIDTVRSENMVGSVRAEGKSLEPEFGVRESAQIVSATHSVLWTKLGTNGGLN